MTTVQIVLGQDVFPEWQVPCASLGRLRRDLVKGLLGEELPLASELVCRADGGEKPLQDSARLPSPPDRLRIEGPNALLRLLDRGLRRTVGPPTETASGASLEAKQERLLHEAVGPWEEVCRAVGASTSGLYFPAGASEQWNDRRVRRVLWLAGRPRPKKNLVPAQRGPPAYGWPGRSARQDSDSEASSDRGVERDGGDGLHSGEEVNGWKVVSKVGHGHVGEVFLVSNASTMLEGLGEKAALKWTLEPQELGTWKAIQKAAPGFPGIPPLLDSGWHKGERYAVTSLLGRDCRWLLPHFKNRSRAQRWRAVRVLGRMLLRRLQAVHRCGYVHCDVSPYNVLFGCTECDDKNNGGKGEGPALVPYLIDFGLARPHPGQPLGAEHGTVEFVSVRSAAGGPRLPEDDLEALGWVMAFLVAGDLPWVGWEQDMEEELQRALLVGVRGDGLLRGLPLRGGPGHVGHVGGGCDDARRQDAQDQALQSQRAPQAPGRALLGRHGGGSQQELKSRTFITASTELQKRLELVDRVRQAKIEVLCGRKVDLPPELDAYFQACSWADPKPIDPPDYQLLAGLLGGRPGLDPEGGEREDIQECRAHVVSLL